MEACVAGLQHGFAKPVPAIPKLCRIEIAKNSYCKKTFILILLRKHIYFESSTIKKNGSCSLKP